MKLDVNGIGIEVDEGGEGDAVLLLHGWPDTHHVWRHQIGPLRSSGYRTIAPDLRGMGASGRPATTEEHHVLHHVGDALGVLDELGVTEAHVVGHDWGAAIAWMLAAMAPERVRSLTALSIGHPTAFREAGIPQREKSWYMLLFQFEGVAERWLSMDGFANLAEWSGHPDLDEVTARLADPEALTASLGIYRATLAPEVLVEPPIELPPVECTTLGLWGAEEFAATEEQMIASGNHVKGPWRYERIEGAGHWIQLEVPDTFSKLLLDHLSG